VAAARAGSDLRLDEQEQERSDQESPLADDEEHEDVQHEDEERHL